MTRVLIVDHDPATLLREAQILKEVGFTPRTAATGDAALACLKSDPLIAAMLLDLVLPDRDGMAVLETMARDGIETPVVMTIANPTPETVTDILRAGAVDFIAKPLQGERLRTTLHNALYRRHLEQALATERHRRAGMPKPSHFIAEAPLMRRAMAVADRARKSRVPVLIEGEPGTGREFLARIIHAAGKRRNKPFVTVRHGFTDFATACLAAQGGTLFVDEIGQLSPATQLMLSQLLEAGMLRNSGSVRPQRLDIRLIASSTLRLLDLTRRGEFREDLFYGFNVLPIYLPPLRQRPEDIEALASSFFIRFAAQLGRTIIGIAPDALQLLKSCPWPLNVRQLEGAVCRAVTLAEDNWLKAPDFPDLLLAHAGREATIKAVANPQAGSPWVQPDFANLLPQQAVGRMQVSDRFVADGKVASLAEVERGLIGFALARYEGRMSEIARALGIGRSTLYRKMRAYGFDGIPESDAA